MKTEDWKTEANLLTALGDARLYDGASRHLRQPRSAPAKTGNLRARRHFQSRRPVQEQPRVRPEHCFVSRDAGCALYRLRGDRPRPLQTQRHLKKILSYHRIHVPNFVVIPRGQRIARPRQLKFPLLVKPVKEEASYGIAQASFVETDEQFRERVAFIHEKHDGDVIAEEYIEGRELYVSLMGNLRLTVFPIRELIFREVPPDEPKIATYRAKWDEEYRKRWGLQNQFAEDLDSGARRADRANVQTHLPSADDRWLRADGLAADGGKRGLFHRGEPKSDSGGGRGLRAFSGQSGFAVSAIDRPDHPAWDEDGPRLIGAFSSGSDAGLRPATDFPASAASENLPGATPRWPANRDRTRH